MRARSVAVGALVLLALVGCGDDDEPEEGQAPPTTTTPTDPGSTESHPFTVPDPPAGFVVRAAGTGQLQQEWGEDCCGSDQPYLVLSPDGTADHPGVVIVALTGYRGYEGGLDQASSGYGDTEVVEVGGQEARFAPAVDTDDPDDFAPGPRWADLVVAQGEDDVAIHVSAPDATFDELAAIVDHVVVPADRSQPPSMPEPPEGLQVVGSVAADAEMATSTFVDQRSDGGPGPETAHGVGWLGGGTDEGDQLVVLTLPGRSADLGALAAGLRWGHEQYGEEATVEHHDDRVTYEHVSDPGFGVPGEVERSVWMRGPQGDLVLVHSRGQAPVALDDLVALGRSVEPADEATWDALVAEAGGPPGLNVDPGRTALMRGEVGDGRQWLLQDQPPGDGNMSASSDDPGWSVDPCLKISDGTRECPGSEAGSSVVWVAAGRGDRTGVHYVIVATRRPEVKALRVTTDGEVAIEPLVDVPGAGERAAVVVGEGYQVDWCQEGAVTGTRTVELADAEGVALPCPP